jgi:hypothetical protein
MDQVTRIEVAKERLASKRNGLAAFSGVGPPCVRCTHYIGGKQPLCGHPVYTEHSFSPVTGGLVQSVQVPASQARAADGLCGPEAGLYERQTGIVAATKANLPAIKRFGFLTSLWLASGFIFWFLTWTLLLGGY